MTDFEIRMLNTTEVGVSALSERAQSERRLSPGLTLAFKSKADAAEYVAVAEEEGFVFKGK